MTKDGFKHLRCQENGPVCVVRFTDPRLVDDLVIREVGKEILAIIDAGNSRLLLDLQDVEYLASGMLGKLITILRRIEQSKGRMGICSINADVQDVFRISKLDSYFKLYGDAPTALQDLAAD